MGKRGRRRKRLFTASRSKRSNRNIQQNVAAKLEDEEQEEDQNQDGDFEDTDDTPAIQYITSRDRSSLTSSSIREYDSKKAIIVQQVVPDNIIKQTTIKTKLSPAPAVQYSLCSKDKSNNVTPVSIKNKIVYITPKRILDDDEQSSIVGIAKKRKFEINSKTVAAQDHYSNVEIVSSIGLPQQQFISTPHTNFTTSSSDAIIINVSQPSIKNVTSPIGPVYLQSNPTNVHFQPPGQNVVGQLTNIPLPAQYPEEREVQLHIEDDDTVNLSEHFSILEEMEADSGNHVLNSDVSHNKTSQMQPIALIAGSHIPLNNTPSLSASTVAQTTSSSEILKIVPEVSASTYVQPGVGTSIVNCQMSSAVNMSVLAPTICNAPSLVTINSSTSPPNQVPCNAPGNFKPSAKMVLATPVVSRRSSMQTVSISTNMNSFPINSGALSLPNNILLRPANDNIKRVSSSLAPNISTVCDDPVTLSTLSTSQIKPGSLTVSNVTSLPSLPTRTLNYAGNPTIVSVVRPVQALTQTSEVNVSPKPTIVPVIKPANSNEIRKISLQPNTAANNASSTVTFAPKTIVRIPRPCVTISPGMNFVQNNITQTGSKVAFDTTHNSSTVTLTSPTVSTPTLLITSAVQAQPNKVSDSANEYRTFALPIVTSSSSSDQVKVHQNGHLFIQSPIVSSCSLPHQISPIEMKNQSSKLERIQLQSNNNMAVTLPHATGVTQQNTVLAFNNKSLGNGSKVQCLQSDQSNPMSINDLESDRHIVTQVTVPPHSTLGIKSSDSSAEKQENLVEMQDSSECFLDKTMVKQEEVLLEESDSMTPSLKTVTIEEDKHNSDDGLQDDDDEDSCAKQSKSFRLLRIKVEEDADNSELDIEPLQRRRRIAFTPSQYKLLQTTFEHNNFPEPADQRSIAQQLGAPYRSIKMWFQNKRAAVRKRLGPDAPRATGSPRTKYKNASDSNSCFYCDLCPAAFIAQPFLKRHKEFHDMNTYLCTGCKAAFTHPDLLVTHMRARCKGNTSSRTSQNRHLSEDDAVDAEPEVVVSEREQFQVHDQTGVDSTSNPSDLSSNTVKVINSNQITSSRFSSIKSEPMNFSTRKSESSEKPSLPTVLNVPKPQSSLNLLAAQHSVAQTSSCSSPLSNQLMNAFTPCTVLAQSSAQGKSTSADFTSNPVFSSAIPAISNKLILSSPNIGNINTTVSEIRTSVSAGNIAVCDVNDIKPQLSCSTMTPTAIVVSKQLTQLKDEPVNLKREVNTSVDVALNLKQDRANLGQEPLNLKQEFVSVNQPAINLCKTKELLNNEDQNTSDEEAMEINLCDQDNRSQVPHSSSTHEQIGSNVESGKLQERDEQDTQDYINVDYEDNNAEEEKSVEEGSQQHDLMGKISELSKVLGQNINPNVRNQLVQQIFLNHIKQQQKEQQSQVLQKLTEYYVHHLQELQKQKSVGNEDNPNNNESNIKLENVAIANQSLLLASRLQQMVGPNQTNVDIKKEILGDKEENNHLNYGNLTIYPIKTKPKVEFSGNQPIDLSSRSNSQSADAESSNSFESSSEKLEEEQAAYPTSTFQQNLLHILSCNNSQSVDDNAYTNDVIMSAMDDGNDVKNILNQDKNEGNQDASPSLLANILSSQNQTLLNLNKLSQNSPASSQSSNIINVLQTLQSNILSVNQNNPVENAFKDHIFASLVNHLKRNSNSTDNDAKSVEMKESTEFDESGNGSHKGSSGMSRPTRRRTTVFSETQHRILYQHFTHCNFPEPAMFRILAKLIGLEAAVIKIWFQNERSRQRKRANFMLEGNKAFADKPYKCMDCDMSFAMATFLVKHSARHSLQEQSQTKTKVCPICTLKFDNDAYNIHLKSVHQVDLAFDDVKNIDEKDESENLTCYICQNSFEDQETLFLHKRDHLTDNYGSVATCSICDSSFVNAICLEAHMQTHYKLDWSFECDSCRARFPEEILLKSHTMSHGIPAPAISSVNRYRSQTQEGHKRGNPALPQQSPEKTTKCKLESSESTTEPNLIDAQCRSEGSLSSITNLDAGGSIPVQIPIQISTSQVTTTQVGTPLAVRTTDAMGRNIIQLLPVHLIPITANETPSDPKDEVAPNASVKNIIASPNNTSGKPKTKKKIPDLIPISECVGLPFMANVEADGDQADEVTSTEREYREDALSSLLKTEDTSDANVFYATSTHNFTNSLKETNPTLISSSVAQSFVSPSAPEKSMLYSLLSDKFGQKKCSSSGRLVPTRDADVVEDSGAEEDEGRPMKSEDTDGTASDDELVIDEGAGRDTEDEGDTGTVPLNAGHSADQQFRLNFDAIGSSLNLPALETNPDLKDKLLQILQAALQQGAAQNRNISDLNNASSNTVVTDSSMAVPDDGGDSNTEASSSKADDKFEFKKFRNRREYTQEEQIILLTHFQNNHFPPTRELKLIARRLNITHRQIMHWFQNRRSKERKALPYSRRVSRQCSDCKATFVHDEGLESHKEVSHNQDSVGVQFGCPVDTCLMKFPNSVLLQTHEFLHERRLDAGFTALNDNRNNEDITASIAKRARKILPKNSREKTNPLSSVPQSLPSLFNLKATLNFPHLEPLSPVEDSPPSQDSKKMLSVPSLLFKSLSLPSYSITESVSSQSTDSGVSVSSVDRSLLSPPSLNTSLASRTTNTSSIPSPLTTSHTTPLHSTPRMTSFSSSSSSSTTSKNPHSSPQLPSHMSPVAHIINKLQLDLSELKEGGKQVSLCGDNSKQQPSVSQGQLLGPKQTFMTSPSLKSGQNVNNPSPLKLIHNGAELRQLELYFEENNFPSPQELAALCRVTGIKKNLLSNWYQTRRTVVQRASNAPELQEHNCPMCSAAFVSKAHLQRHIALHSDNAAYTCDVCQAVFRHKSVYDSHAQEHAESAPVTGTLTTVALLSPTRSLPPEDQLAATLEATDSSEETNILSDEDNSEQIHITEGCMTESETKNSKEVGMFDGHIEKSAYTGKPPIQNLSSPQYEVKSKGILDLSQKCNSAKELTCRRSSTGNIIISKLDPKPLLQGNKFAVGRKLHSKSPEPSVDRNISSLPHIGLKFSNNSINSSVDLESENLSTATSEIRPIFCTIPASSPTKCIIKQKLKPLTLEVEAQDDTDEPATHPKRKKLKPSILNECVSSVIGSTQLSDWQLKVLEINYVHNNLPRERELRLVAKHVNLPVLRVARWYADRRLTDRQKLKIRPARLRCPTCTSYFICRDHLQQHIQNHLMSSTATKSYACTNCGVVFNNEILLETHLFSHGPKVYRSYIKRKRLENKKSRKIKKFKSCITDYSSSNYSFDSGNIFVEPQTCFDSSEHITNISHDFHEVQSENTIIENADEDYNLKQDLILKISPINSEKLEPDLLHNEVPQTINQSSHAEAFEETPNTGSRVDEIKFKNAETCETLIEEPQKNNNYTSEIPSNDTDEGLDESPNQSFVPEKVYSSNDEISVDSDRHESISNNCATSNAEAMPLENVYEFKIEASDSNDSATPVISCKTEAAAESLLPDDSSCVNKITIDASKSADNFSVCVKSSSVTNVESSEDSNEGVLTVDSDHNALEDSIETYTLTQYMTSNDSGDS